MSLVGGYSQFSDPDASADKVLTDNYDSVHAVNGLGDMTLEVMLKNYKYSKQVVAGLNYKFHITHTDGTYEVVIWHKLDNTYVFTYGAKLPASNTGASTTTTE